MPTVRYFNEWYFTNRDMLYAVCAWCKAHLPWRHVDGKNRLTGSCCGYIYEAIPATNGKYYQVRSKQADMSNVIQLSVLDSA